MQRIGLSSTSIASVGYDGYTRTVEIEFRSGSLYHYYGVPMRVYHDLLESGAPGVYLNLNLNLKLAGYAYRRVA